jgi:translocation and assembly module TamA
VTGRPCASVAAVLAASFVLAGCGLLGGSREAGEDEIFGEERDLGPTIPYEVAFEGGIDDALRAALVAASAARRDASRPPASTFLLERRAEADVPNLVSALHSLGYYDGTVEYAVAGGHAGTEEAGREAARLMFRITPGERYRFAGLEVKVAGEAAGFTAPRPAELELKPGEPARAATVVAAQEKLVAAARDAGHPFAQGGELDAVIDRDTKTMDVTLTLQPGPRATLAEPAFTGAGGIGERFLRRRVPFAAGDPFSPAAVEGGRQALVDTNLFSTVIVNQGTELDAQGRLPVTYDVTQRKHRSIGAGIGFQTDEGPNASVFWEHRNFLGAGERLRLDAYGSIIRQEISALFRKPDVGRRDQNLLADASIRREDTDAYESRSFGTGLGLERRFTRELTGSLGVAYRLASITEEDEEEETFGLLSLPVRMDWDYSNSLLDPTTGGRVFVTAAPFTDTLGFDINFFKSQVTATRYLELTRDPRLVLAVRSSVGSIAGADRDEIPADERFYSGGGGSVRGFGYQLAGPVDDDDNPLGGLSLFEANAELRYRITESIGIVGFLDSGTVFDAVVPDFSEDLHFGTGLGLRYVTPIGPLRLDVAVPLNPRSGVDDPYQVYISIGQAF